MVAAISACPRTLLQADASSAAAALTPSAGDDRWRALPESKKEEPSRMRVLVLGLVALIAGCATMRKVQGPSQEQRPYASPEDERQAVVAKLEASGPSDEPWTRDAAAVFNKWKKGKGTTGVTLSSVRCFRDGCVATATYDSIGRANDLDKGLAASRGFQDWPGARYRSGVVKDGKKVATDWILFRPEAGAPADAREGEE